MLSMKIHPLRHPLHSLLRPRFRGAKSRGRLRVGGGVFVRHGKTNASMQLLLTDTFIRATLPICKRNHQPRRIASSAVAMN